MGLAAKCREKPTTEEIDQAGDEEGLLRSETDETRPRNPNIQEDGDDQA